jgi:hypothetical protein
MKWPTTAVSVTCPYCDTKISLPVAAREQRPNPLGRTVLITLDRMDLDRHEDGRCLS